MYLQLTTTGVTSGIREQKLSSSHKFMNLCLLTFCGECVAELTLVAEGGESFGGGGNRSGGQPLRKQKTKRSRSHCPLSAMLDSQPQSKRAQGAAESDSQKDVMWQLSAPRTNPPGSPVHLLPAHLPACSPQSSHIPVCLPQPPPHPPPHFCTTVCTLVFLVGFTFSHLMWSNLMSFLFQILSCKSTTIESFTSSQFAL